MYKSNLEFVFLAAGNSTRNYLHTRGIAHKSLLPLGSKKIIDYIIDEICQTDINNINFVINDIEVKKEFEKCLFPNKQFLDKLQKNNQLIAGLTEGMFLKRNKIIIKYIIQNKPYGLAHAIGLVAKNLPGKNLAIILPDDIIVPANNKSLFKAVLDTYAKNENRGNLFVTRIVEDISRWGIIENGLLQEKPAVSTSNQACNMLFILDKDICTILADVVDRIEQKDTPEYKMVSAGKEIHYSMYLNEAINNDYDNMHIKTYQTDNKDVFLDCGTLKGYEQAMLYTLLMHSAYKKENLNFINSILHK